MLYYVARTLQFLGLLLTANAVLVNWGELGPDRKMTAVGIIAFVVGWLLLRRFRA